MSRPDRERSEARERGNPPPPPPPPSPTEVMIQQAREKRLLAEAARLSGQVDAVFPPTDHDELLTALLFRVATLESRLEGYETHDHPLRHAPGYEAAVKREKERVAIERDERDRS